MSIIKTLGDSGNFVRIIKMSFDFGTSAKGIFAPSRSIKTFEPVSGAKPPKIPVPASHSIEKKEHRSAAGAIVTEGTRLMIRPRFFSTFNKM